MSRSTVFFQTANPRLVGADIGRGEQDGVPTLREGLSHAEKTIRKMGLKTISSTGPGEYQADRLTQIARDLGATAAWTKGPELYLGKATFSSRTAQTVVKTVGPRAEVVLATPGEQEKLIDAMTGAASNGEMRKVFNDVRMASFNRWPAPPTLADTLAPLHAVIARYPHTLEPGDFNSKTAGRWFDDWQGVLGSCDETHPNMMAIIRYDDGTYRADPEWPSAIGLVTGIVSPEMGDSDWLVSAGDDGTGALMLDWAEGPLDPHHPGDDPRLGASKGSGYHSEIRYTDPTSRLAQTVGASGWATDEEDPLLRKEFSRLPRAKPTLSYYANKLPLILDMDGQYTPEGDWADGLDEKNLKSRCPVGRPTPLSSPRWIGIE